VVRGPPVRAALQIGFLFLLSACAAAIASCSSRAGNGSVAPSDDGGGSTGTPDSSSADLATSGESVPPSGGSGGGTGFIDIGDADLTSKAMPTLDPMTCDEAANAHSYIGCDYWPTVVANTVWDIFDFAVVIANAGQNPASVTVTGPSSTNQTATVPPGELVKMYLPWVPALKGAAADTCGNTQPQPSVLQGAGAFHLVSTAPVIVYQFNALEYEPKGGPPNKDWSSCPGYKQCTDPMSPNVGNTPGCYSFSNDASILLPSTAMTGNYRVVAHEGVSLAGQSQTRDAYMAITGTQDSTTVKVTVSKTGQIKSGQGIQATSGGGALTLVLNAGDVAELVAAGGSDLSGSLVQATAPVQIITGHPCIQIPPTQPACDHMEESVVPAETLGKDYVVTGPAGPGGVAVAHRVRFYGNFDNTHLTYNPSTVPPGCPTTLNAGDVVECGVPACPAMADLTQMLNCGITLQDFEVKADQPFAVATFTLGSWVVDPTGSEGDPAQSFPTPVEQYRSKYVFLAPDDYRENYVDIVAKPQAQITLDGQPLSAQRAPVGDNAYSVYRVKLGPGQAGAHVLTASQRIGIQVVGYGTATSYMYPGGLDLANIAPPPAQ
jgi:hypothetical protein